MLFGLTPPNPSWILASAEVFGRTHQAMRIGASIEIFAQGALNGE
jgi:hypothetical protein